MRTALVAGTAAAFVLAFMFFVAAAHASSMGSIRGVVIDEAGKPVHLASVLAFDNEPTPSGTVEVQMGALRWVETDKEGQFVIRGLVTGHHYKMYAKKEEDGYADPMIPTYNPNDEGPIVIASDAPRSSADVRLQLGPKAVVFSYDLKDAVTGKPIRDYAITVTRLDTNYSFGGVEGDNKVLLPADTDMSIKFEVKGYQPWYYPGRNTQEAAAPLRGASGEEKHVEVLLKPETAAP
jgi:hypothetical protein